MSDKFFLDTNIFVYTFDSQTDILYSEDFQANQKIESIKIVNPFQ